MNADKRQLSKHWFESLRDRLCKAFECIEVKFCQGEAPSKFSRKLWQRPGGGGGQISILRGKVFEKVGVNVSTVYGEFSEKFRAEIPGAKEDPRFFATGISVVAHMKSPLIPAVHFNTRYIETKKSWFGGGGDLTPIYPDHREKEVFHQAFKVVCDRYDSSYYQKFKDNCDRYFYLPHRDEPRGVGGVFFDYLDTKSFEKDFSFTKDIGLAFLDVYPKLVEAKMDLSWTKEQRQFQLVKRGRYVEFNLLYDRGTKFGLMTGGNTEAILMSLPPQVSWA